MEHNTQISLAANKKNQAIKWQRLYSNIVIIQFPSNDILE